MGQKNYDFEYVVRSNSSTYINVKEIEKFIESLDLNTPIYAGRSQVLIINSIMFMDLA